MTQRILARLSVLSLLAATLGGAALAEARPGERGHEDIHRGGPVHQDIHRNNVNVNKNVNVDVHGNSNDNWHNDHPVATAAAVTATVAVTAAVVGSVVRSVPSNCGAVVVGGVAYQQCGSTWYQPQPAGTYVVVRPPY